uniref:mannose-6-phosphate isomerase-like n=1 Tax=Styela clava TaxID=7725 RepID=UPI001939AB3E|nr:mannose-6-phosphate isomerase-like [Styela clava]
MGEYDRGSTFELRCEVQQYAWGKIGSASEVARLSSSAHADFAVAEDEPYAELWMGAHPKAPSQILTPKTSLSLLEYIKKNPEVLGKKVNNVFKGELPFLLKVLSVNKSLSIQAHPNKSHAEKLFAERPDIYKDPNHKPEMAIALTPFEGMCGFRPLKEIQMFLKEVPEFRAVVGESEAENIMKCKPGDEYVAKALKSCFENVMKCNAEVRKKNLSKLISRISVMDQESDSFSKYSGELLLRLNSQFPGDVGCFVVYFLNHIILKPGEAMFLGANEPHAYLDGNCIECMACSDNVVRAGLTPKLIDVPTLCEMLNYQPATPESKIFPSIQKKDDPYVKEYNPPVDDFAVQYISIPKGISEYTIKAIDSASILLVFEGKGAANKSKPSGLDLRPGAVFFISADTDVAISLSKTPFIAFRALCIL